MHKNQLHSPHPMSAGGGSTASSSGMEEVKSVSVANLNN